jgi:hypothetical protein
MSKVDPQPMKKWLAPKRPYKQISGTGVVQKVPAFIRISGEADDPPAVYLGTVVFMHGVPLTKRARDSIESCNRICK